MGRKKNTWRASALRSEVAPVTGPTVGMPLASIMGKIAAVLAVPRGEIKAKIDCASTISVTFFNVRAAT
ncbi:hypothetical protein D3C71_2011210 [compost metagenome]